MILKIRGVNYKMKSKRFFTYLKRQYKSLILSFILVGIYLIAQLSQPLLIGRAIDYALNMNINGFTTCLIITLLLSVFGAIADFFFEYSIGKMTQKIIFDIRCDVYNKYNSVSIEKLNSTSNGDLLRLEIGDVENIANGLVSVFKSFVEGVLSIIITIIMMFVVDWILALTVIVLTPISLLVSRFVAKFTHSHFKKQAKLQSNLNAISIEALENIETLQSLNYEKEFVSTFKKEDDNLKKEGKVAQFSASWTNPVTRMVNNIIYSIVGIFGIIMIIFSPNVALFKMSIGKLSSFLTYTNQYTKPFNDISSVLSEYETAVFSFNRIDDFLSTLDDIDTGKDTLDNIDEIQFDNLYFSYNKDKKLIENFNQVIKKGQKVAIVGPTGAGKTTLINLLMRFYDPLSGEINISNKNYLNVSKYELRKHFGMVLQDTWIFNGTIKDNIRYAKEDATDEQIIEAAKQSHADSFINLLPNGYDTIICDNGSLSAGEKQMIALARVMLLNKEVVILDEATSNIDTRSEQLISDAFDNLLKGKTSIVIAHRLSSIINADVILVLKDGNIIEQGTHNQLMQKKGFYYSMYSSQFK